MEKEFIQVKDDSGHRFVIPFERRDEWDEWVQDDTEAGWEVPEYAVGVDGGDVVFKEWVEK